VTRKTKARDRYQAAYDAANDLFDKIEPEEPPQPEIVAVRGRTLACPHCGAISYFGVGKVPGIDRAKDFSARGTSVCCGKAIEIRLGATMTVVKG